MRVEIELRIRQSLEISDAMLQECGRVADKYIGVSLGDILQERLVFYVDMDYAADIADHVKIIDESIELKWIDPPKGEADAP